MVVRKWHRDPTRVPGEPAGTGGGVFILLLIVTGDSAKADVFP